MRSSILLLLLTACQDYEIKGTDELINGSDETGEPNIVVSPEFIAFGQVEVGAETTRVETVTVSNTGDEALEIHGLNLADDDMRAVYTVSAIGAVLVPPGGITTFTVAYEPETAQPYNTSVLIDSNDPDQPQVDVPLTAEGLAPEITVSPESYDFGTMYIGCVSAHTVNIANTGNAPLEVSEIDYISASDDLAFDDNVAVNGPLPWIIPAGESRDVTVTYSPLDDYADDGYLAVTSNDPFRGQAQAFQTGGGSLYGENLDLFDQPIRGSTDILFVIDNSCSMANEQASLASNFEFFAAELSVLDLDYQIGVITTDNPAFRGEILTADTSDMEAEFISQTSAGTGGSGNEMPSEMAYQATQPGADAGPDSDFLRDDAMLSMIFVSDEPDSSPSLWSDYLDYFRSIKDDEDNFIAHAISGDYPTGCGDASATNKVYEMTTATEGLYLSVCATDWASHLEALVEGSAADLSSFELTEWPVPETIVVRVDGVTTTIGWEYNSTDRSIDFDESYIPEGGSTIEVEYALFGDCEG